MGVSYKRLWKLLIDHNMKKVDLKNATKISSATMSKLNKDEPVSLEVLMKICKVLKCDIGDVVEMVFED